jgi:hypothetical protein
MLYGKASALQSLSWDCAIPSQVNMLHQPGRMAVTGYLERDDSVSFIRYTFQDILILLSLQVY